MLQLNVCLVHELTLQQLLLLPVVASHWKLKTNAWEYCVTNPLLLLQILNHIFEGSDEKVDRLSFGNQTYVIKAKPSPATEPGRPQLLVAFSGCKYIFICRSLTKYIIVQSDGRRGEEWLNDAVKWLTKLSQILINKKY